LSSVLLVTAALWLIRGHDADPRVDRGAIEAGALTPSAAAAVPLGALRAAPAQHLGQEVRFTLQFRALSEQWEPFLSRFEPTRWLALEGWPDEAFTWDAETFAAPARRLFVRRGGGFEPLARRARPYQRFEVRAKVRELFQNEPWLEVLELVPLEGEVGEGTILHVTRARELLLQGQFDLALEQYARARAAPLPPHALSALVAETRVAEETRARNADVERAAPEPR
jgi:hypothetical protein